MSEFTPSISGKDPSDIINPELNKTINYNSKYGQVPESKQVNVLTPSEIPQLKHFGYKFLGWFYDTACTQPVEIGNSVTADITLEAGWELIPPKIDISNLHLKKGSHYLSVKVNKDSSRLNYNFEVKI